MCGISRLALLFFPYGQTLSSLFSCVINLANLFMLVVVIVGQTFVSIYSQGLVLLWFDFQKLLKFTQSVWEPCRRLPSGDRCFNRLMSHCFEITNLREVIFWRGFKHTADGRTFRRPSIIAFSENSSKLGDNLWSEVVLKCIIITNLSKNCLEYRSRGPFMAVCVYVGTSRATR